MVISSYERKFHEKRSKALRQLDNRRNALVSEMSNIDVVDLKNMARGRWIGIFRQFGMNVRDDGRHSGCPVCGNGRNGHRFRIHKDGSGRWICTQCGAGDAITLVQRYLGCNFPEALEKIQSVIGGCEKVESQKPGKTYDIKASLNKLWTASTPLTGSDPASKYLHSRGITLTPENIRYCEKCYNKEKNSGIPALIARIQNKEGKPISLHRIYLQDVTPKKKLMPGTESLNGCAIRLFMPGGMFDDGVLGIAEGVETAVSCAQLFQIATWAAISTSIMESFEPPEGIRKIIIFADRDANMAGQAAAYSLAKKLFTKDLIVSVEMPDEVGDFNDILKGVK